MSRIRLQTSTRLRQGLSPRLQNSIRLLGLNQMELRDLIKAKITENPFLEEKSPAKNGKNNSGEDRIFREASEVSYGQLLDYSSRSDQSMMGSGADAPAIDHLSDGRYSVQDSLNFQIKLMKIPDRLIPLAEAIISDVDTHGLATTPHLEMARSMGFTQRDVVDLLAWLRRLDPPGVTSESIWQNLEWQAVRRFPENQALPDILAVLEQLGASVGRLDAKLEKKLAEHMNLPENTLRSEFNKLKELNLFPLQGGVWQPEKNQDSVGGSRDSLYPEISFEVREGRINIHLYRRMYPELSVNQGLYEELKKAAQKSSAKKLTSPKEQSAQGDSKQEEPTWQDMYDEALNLVKSIDFRNDILLKLARLIAIRQSEFFFPDIQKPSGAAPAPNEPADHKDHKNPFSRIKPMTLQEVASELGAHVSTISRIARHKYCQTPFGVFPLKAFFQRKVKTDDGALRGVGDLKSAIESIVRTEGNENLSDREILEKLRVMGFAIQRRTVAKYRKLLLIPSSVQRKVPPNK